jgi:hypothetical protein
MSRATIEEQLRQLIAKRANETGSDETFEEVEQESIPQTEEEDDAMTVAEDLVKEVLEETAPLPESNPELEPEPEPQKETTPDVTPDKGALLPGDTRFMFIFKPECLDCGYFVSFKDDYATADNCGCHYDQGNELCPARPSEDAGETACQGIMVDPQYKQAARAFCQCMMDLDVERLAKISKKLLKLEPEIAQKALLIGRNALFNLMLEEATNEESD